MCSLFEFTDCHLIINDTCIYPSEETQFLGFTLDYRLKWAAHISNKVIAAKNAFFALKKYLRATWGIDKQRLRFLIASTIEPIILYGCPVWASFLWTKSGI